MLCCTAHLPIYIMQDDDGQEDKKQFFDLWSVPYVGGMRVHPLPLLTADGNGRGGGDYYCLDMNLVGSCKQFANKMQTICKLSKAII